MLYVHQSKIISRPVMNFSRPYHKLLIVFLFVSNTAAAEDIYIALRAFKGTQIALQQWQPTADYLTEKIPGYRFILVPFENIGVQHQSISLGNFDFCITNPASAVEYQIRYGAEPLATRVNKRQGKGFSKFGSVIFTLSNREDIKQLEDLKGKTFAAVDELAFGGWRLAWREFLDNGINPYTDFKALRFAVGNQQDVVYDVRDGNADAGTVRTDMLERMAASGNINLDNYKIIGNKTTEGFPFWHSTPLYPEWAFSATRKMDADFKAKVVNTLLSIPEDSSAAMQGRYIGWIKPLDYTPVDKLLKDLNVGPYQVATMAPLQRLISQYGNVLLIIIIVIGLLTLIIMYMLRLNRHLTFTRNSLEHEINTRKILERQLIQIQKMESLGQLTGGIAHDFNNMLAIILGFTELSLKSETATKDSKLSKHLDQVISAGEKAKMLVNQMLAFSRSEADIEKAEVLSVSNIIEELYQLLRPLLPSSIDLEIKEIDDNLYINISQVMINQVLMNLCLNAKDAITENHGVISIGADTVELVHAQCSSCHQDISGVYITIQVEDTGCGIEPLYRERLFEPFFTTKEVGKGTGMGLSMVHGIIHNHGGHILLDSEVNTGTAIKILLPSASKKEKYLPAKKYQQPVTTAIDNTHKHILLVDDEKSITIYLNELLQQHGFKVTSFNDSPHALAYFEKHHNDIDLVLTDQTMPDITGIDMAAMMLTLSKDMPIILCTGYSEQTDEKTAMNLNIRAFMKKPIHSDELIKQINSLIKKPGE